MKKHIANDLTQKFNKKIIVIHWVTAFLILLLFPLGKYMEGINPAQKMGMIKLHAILGLVVFILTLLRTWYFFKSPRPTHLKTNSKLNDMVIIWIHNLFYFLLFGLGLSGIAVMFSGGYIEALQSGQSEYILKHAEIAPMKAHELLAIIMIILLILHALGVVKHYIFTKENTLKRIS